MKTSLDFRAGATVTGLFLGSLALSGAVALVTAPITPRMAVARDGGASERPTVRSISLVTPAVAVQGDESRFPIH